MAHRTYLADELLQARAELAAAQEHVAALERTCRLQAEMAGDNVLEGALARVVVSTYVRSTTAWKAIAEKLGASPQMIRANTSKAEVTKITCTALTKRVAA